MAAPASLPLKSSGQAAAPGRGPGSDWKDHRATNNSGHPVLQASPGHCKSAQNGVQRSTHKVILLPLSQQPAFFNSECG